MSVGPFRLRTITAGVSLRGADDLAPVETALATLARAKARFEAEGYEVQTIRVATNPVIAALGAGERDEALDALVRLDALIEAHGAMCGLGPLLTIDVDDAALPGFAAELIRRTKRTSFSVAISTIEGGPMPLAARTAARVMTALAGVLPGGLGNFRFGAAANVPGGTPFFPVAWHAGAPSLALGLECAALVGEGMAGAASVAEATAAVRARLDAAFHGIARIAADLATEARCRYLGIDPSPAPGLERSIGAAIEGFTGAPFGASGTLEACGAVTAALKSLDARICGYAGLMLPVLEDGRLAQRATEGRYGIRDLLLYSSVCGTGLDVVPVPGDATAEVLARLLRDVAALADKWGKPLSARLLPVPGKKAGEVASFDDRWLTACRVFALD